MIWLAENWGTIAVLAAIGVAVFFIVRKMIKDRKRGIGSCGCECASCAMRSSCAGTEKKA